MNRTRIAVICGIVLVMVSGCTSAGLLGGEATAEGIARDMIYGSEYDEALSAAPAGGSKALSEAILLDETLVRYGAISGTATITRNITATEVEAGGTAYNGLYTFNGERDIAFEEYSNVPARTIKSGRILVEISGGTFQSSTESGEEPEDGDTVTRTVTDVEKRLTGDVVVLVRGREYACAMDLSVSVERRVIDWTYDSGTPHLILPQLRERNVHITGTVTVDGEAYLVDRQILVTAAE